MPTAEQIDAAIRAWEQRAKAAMEIDALLTGRCRQDLVAEIGKLFTAPLPVRRGVRREA